LPTIIVEVYKVDVQPAWQPNKNRGSFVNKLQIDKARFIRK